MFSFLNTGVLLAATAALIPLIIHLFSRRRVKIVEFSSLKHLQAMQRRQVRRLRIRQLLLLLLRMLIIFTVVLAFARPTTSGGSIGSHASVSAVILFDNSGSMNRYVKDGLLFDLAKKMALELLENFGEGDELAVLTYGEEEFLNRDISFTSPAIVREKISSMVPGYSGGNLGSALDKASELMQSAHNLNRELYIISDRQRNSLPEEVKSLDSTIMVYLVELPLEEAENIG
ncbi:MAG: BatA domain-containing protein, partial [Candidatus Zixiibacteriota bacterium]